VSLLPLLTDLIWKSLNINLVNINISYWALISTLMILILLRVNTQNHFILITCILIYFLYTLSSCVVLLTVIFILVLQISQFSVLHVLIANLVANSLTSYEYYYSYWLNNMAKITFSSINNSESYCAVCAYSYPFIIKNMSLSSPLILSSNTTFNTVLFKLQYSLTLVTQTFLSGEGRLLFTTSIIDNFSSYLVTSYLTFLAIMFFEKKRVLIIKC